MVAMLHILHIVVVSRQGWHCKWMEWGSKQSGHGREMILAVMVTFLALVERNSMTWSMATCDP